MKKIIKVSVIITLSLFLYSSAFAESSLNLLNKASLAGSQAWKDVFVAKGGDVMIGVNFMGDLYISNDAGSSWQKRKSFNGEIPEAVVSSESSKYMVVALYNDYIYTSSDYGNSWKKSNSKMDVWSGLASTPDGDIVVAIAGSQLNNEILNRKISISNDRGNTWTELPNSPNKFWRSVDISADGNTIVASAYKSDYIYVSKDRGNTWSQKSDQRNWRSVTVSGDGKTIFASVIKEIEYTVDNPDSGISRTTYFSNAPLGYLYKSDDSGNTWKEIKNNGLQDWREIAVSYSGDVVIAATSDKGVFFSLDGGNSFLNKNLGPITNVAVSDDGHTFIVSSKDVGFIYVSKDSGNNWNLDMVGSILAWSSASISSDGSTIVATPTFGFIYLSKDYGHGWKILTSGGLRNWTSVSLSSDSNKVFATYISDDVGSKGKIIVSQDGGESFNKVNNLDDYFTYISASGDGRTVLAASGLLSNNDPKLYGYIYKSTNSGMSWSIVDVLGKEPWKLVKVSENGMTMIAVRHVNVLSSNVPSQEGAKVFVSRNAGQSWSEVTSIGSALWRDVSLSREGSTIVIVGDSRNIFISRDYGVTWTESLASGKYGWESVNLDKDLNIYAVAGGGIYISKDKGLTWVKDDVPFFSVKHVAMSPSSNFLASFRDNNDVSIFRTSAQIVDLEEEDNDVPEVVENEVQEVVSETADYNKVNLSQEELTKLVLDTLNALNAYNQSLSAKKEFTVKPTTDVSLQNKLTSPVRTTSVPNPESVISTVNTNQTSNISIPKKIIISNSTLNNIANPVLSNVSPVLKISLPVAGTAVELNNDEKKELVVKFNTNKIGEHKIQVVSVSTGSVTDIGSVNVGTPGDINYVKVLTLDNIAYGFYRVRVCYDCDGSDRTYVESANFVFRSGTPAVGYNLNTNINFTQDSSEVNIETDGSGNKIVTSVFRGKVKALGADLQIPTFAGDVFYDLYVNNSRTSTYNSMMWSSLAKSSNSSLEYDQNDLQKVNGRFVLPNNQEIGFTFRSSANLGNYIPEGAPVKIVLRMFRTDTRYFTVNWFAEKVSVSKLRDKLRQFASVILAPWK